MRREIKYIFVMGILSVILFAGWGGTAHKLINFNSTIFFPSEMSAFSVWNYSLQTHASDADNRKTDQIEGQRHFIDIDDYYEFNTTGQIPQDSSILNKKYGSSKVIDIGILPWATISAFESLKIAFKNRDWNNAVLYASDLGHYVGDGHQPLHLTKNYNGQLTGQNGIHTPRYETTMIGKYSSQITFSSGTAEYVSNVPDFVFGYIYGNYQLVDSILAADLDAKAAAGGSTSSDKYYEVLWDRTKGYTIPLINFASKRFAALMYTAWVDAGKPDLNSTFVESMQHVLNGFEVCQNYPNPFNPSTVIKFSTFAKSNVSLKVFDLTGKEILTLVNEEKPAGIYQYSFDAGSLPSGVYFYTLTSGSNSVSKKMVLMR